MRRNPEEIVDVPRTNYSVLRLTRDVFSSSRIGLIGINKQNGDAYNRGLVDSIFRTARGQF